MRLGGIGWALAVVALLGCGIASSPASARTSAKERLCVRAFSGANETTHGNETRYNRQASVQAVSCNGFGFDVRFEVDGGVVCSLLSAAIGRRYAHLALYIDGSCSAPTLASQHDAGSESGVACTMLSDLLSAAPWAKGYATAAGVACAFGRPLGSWIESASERQAAEAVIRSGRCLKFTTHRFPLTDDWSAAPCGRSDRGFSDLFRSPSPQTTRVLQVSPVDASSLPKPGLRVRERGSADSCGAGSDSVGNAYRCFADKGGVYDPCWYSSVDGSDPAVLCQLVPWSSTVTRLTLPQGGVGPFFAAAPPVEKIAPWGMQIATGEQCVAEQGAHDNFHGHVVDYACARSHDRSWRVLLRGVDRSHKLWRVESAFYDSRTNRYTPGATVRVKTAWFAAPDTADARMAASGICSAGALANAAQAYESANGEPDGPLPTIIDHACDSGYAFAIFEQDAPPPGYEAMTAFRSTSGGWEFAGRSDYIAPGDFDIPPEATANLISILSSRPHTEGVPF